MTRVITMDRVNLWELESLHFPRVFSFESRIYHLEITLKWSPLYYRKEEVLVIQYDSDR